MTEEAVTEEAKPEIKTFAYTGVPDRDTVPPKEHAQLGRSEIIRADVQIVREGGANNLHAHTGNDGFWMVLKGKARFYGEGHSVVGEFNPHEGALIPHGAPYWFESIGDVDLELLHVGARDMRVPDRRIDYEPPKRSRRKAAEGES